METTKRGEFAMVSGGKTTVAAEPEVAMAKHRPVRWLTRRAAIGVKDFPTNARWLSARVRQSPTKTLAGATEGANAVGSSVASVLSQAGRSIAEHMPFTGSDTSVEALIHEARRSADGARGARA